MNLPRLVLMPVLSLVLALHVNSLCAASDDIRTMAFPLVDVIDPVRDFPASLQADLQDAAVSTTRQLSDRERMEAFLRRSFEPNMVDLILSHSTIQDTVLTVTGTSSLCDHITNVLTQLRSDLDLQVHTHMSLMLMDPRIRQQQCAFRDLGWKELPGNPGLAFASLSPAQTIAVNAQLNAVSGIRCGDSPSITCYSHQLANATFKTTYAYPRIAFTASGPAIADGQLGLGSSFQVRATATHDHRFIHLSLAYDTSKLLSSTVISLGTKPDGTALTAEEPQLWNTHEQIDQEIENGNTLILSTGLFLEKDQPPRAGFLIVTCQLLDPHTPAATNQAQVPLRIQNGLGPSESPAQPTPRHTTF